jgi:hypothetical protein
MFYFERLNSKVIINFKQCDSKISHSPAYRNGYLLQPSFILQHKINQCNLFFTLKRTDEVQFFLLICPALIWGIWKNIFSILLSKNNSWDHSCSKQNSFKFPNQQELRLKCSINEKSSLSNLDVPDIIILTHEQNHIIPEKLTSSFCFIERKRIYYTSSRRKKVKNQVSS